LLGLLLLGFSCLGIALHGIPDVLQLLLGLLMLGLLLL
jgi:hypothetical protein